MTNIVSEEQIIKTLRKYNSWWIDKNSVREYSKEYKRVAYKDALSILNNDTLRRFVVLSGARRVGKTTIMYQLMESLIDSGINERNILYVSFDNPIIKLINIEDVISIYESLYPTTGIKYLFLDEIQYTEEWELWLKVLYDTRRDLKIVATGSASPILERKSTDSGTGRWTVIRIPTLSFYEYCKLLNLEEPELPDITISSLYNKTETELGDIMSRFSPFVVHFNRYLTIGGFPELVLSNDDKYAQRMLREDVVDKVIKRDVLTLFKVRSPLLMEKLFLYLCLNSSEIFNITAVSKVLENVSTVTLENYLEVLELSNLIYIAPPIDVGGKGVLKGKPKIFIADVAIRNAVLMVDEVLSDEKELGIMVETAVYKHLVSYYQGQTARLGYFRKAKDNQNEVDAVVETPKERILCEVKYRNTSRIPEKDAIVELCRTRENGVSKAFLITKRLEDCGKTQHDTEIPIIRIPAIAFLYIMGKEEAMRC